MKIEAVIRDEKCQRWAKEIAYQVELLATKPGYLSLITGTHMIEGKKQLPKVVL